MDYASSISMLCLSVLFVANSKKKSNNRTDKKHAIIPRIVHYQGFQNLKVP